METFVLIALLVAVVAATYFGSRLIADDLYPNGSDCDD